MKFKRWYVFPAVFIVWFTTTGAGCGLGESSTGAGSEISIVGDNNQVCVVEGTAQDDVENLFNDCPRPGMGGEPEEPEEPGES